MKTNLIITAAIFSATLSTEANARKGGEVGNGGGAHICYTDASKTQIKSIETYDLFEGRTQYKLPLQEMHELLDLSKLNSDLARKLIEERRANSKQLILDAALAQIEKQYPELKSKIDTALKLLRNPDYLIDATNIRLTPVPDSKHLMVGVHCDYHQMVNWQDPGQLLPGSPDQILRDESVYSVMSATSQAALDLHEATYKVYREYADPKILEQYHSRPVRKLVAQAMAGTHIDPLIPESQIVEGVFLNPESKSVLIRLKENGSCNKGDVKISIRWKNPTKKNRVEVAFVNSIRDLFRDKVDSRSVTLGNVSEPSPELQFKLPFRGQSTFTAYVWGSVHANIPVFLVTVKACDYPEVAFDIQSEPNGSSSFPSSADFRVNYENSPM